MNRAERRAQRERLMARWRRIVRRWNSDRLGRRIHGGEVYTEDHLNEYVEREARRRVVTRHPNGHCLCCNRQRQRWGEPFADTRAKAGHEEELEMARISPAYWSDYITEWNL